jgi:hypothetical protein
MHKPIGWDNHHNRHNHQDLEVEAFDCLADVSIGDIVVEEMADIGFGEAWADNLGVDDNHEVDNRKVVDRNLVGAVVVVVAGQRLVVVDRDLLELDWRMLVVAVVVVVVES